MKLKFRQPKKPIKLKFFNPKMYPARRSKKELRLIQINPFGDTDRDGVINLLDCKPLNRKKQGWAHQGIQFNRERSTHIRMMTPDKFLRTTQREVYNRTSARSTSEDKSKLLTYYEPEHYEKAVIVKENVERLKPVLKSKTKQMDVPFLEYDEQGRPTDHEGRHRAVAARELGIKLIPVTIARKLEEPRDWKNMRKSWKYKGTKHDWRNELENVDEVTSSASADIPLKEQKEYGVEKPETLKSLKEELREDLKDE